MGIARYLSKLGSVLSAEGVVPVSKGGTGSSTTSGAKTALGLVIGTDVLSPTGSAASLTSFPTFNQNTTGTAAGLSTTLVAASGGTGITSPGASGNILVSNGTAWLSAASATRVVALADATTATINADTTDIATQANTQATGTLTIAAPTGTPTNGQKIIFRLQSTNVQTFSWNAIFTGSTDLALPTTSTGTSKYDYVGFMYNSTAAKWQLLAKNFGH